MIISKNSIKITATLLAKNEEDIIGANIEHHLSHGVDCFIITNNNSTDKTRQIVEKYPEVKEIIDENEDDHNQSKWVTRMAQIACKMETDWVVHLDADELWCGLTELRNCKENLVGSNKMFLHPPTGKDGLQNMKKYLDFSNFKNIPGEQKVMHRPDPNIVITHGNHGFSNGEAKIIEGIHRHHYPIRNEKQFFQKAVNGHQALLKRNAICNRWKKWYDFHINEGIEKLYQKICQNWLNMIENPNHADFLQLLNYWSEPEVIDYFSNINLLPNIGEWPKGEDERKNDFN